MCLHVIHIFQPDHSTLLKFYWRRHLRRNSSFSYNILRRPKDRYLSLRIFHLQICSRLPFWGLYVLSYVLVIILHLNSGCIQLRMCRHKSFISLYSVTQWLRQCRILPLALAANIMILVSQVLIIYLYVKKGTPIQQLNNGYQCITVLHLPKNLFIINHHFSNLINSLIYHSRIPYTTNYNSKKYIKKQNQKNKTQKINIIIKIVSPMIFNISNIIRNNLFLRLIVKDQFVFLNLKSDVSSYYQSVLIYFSIYIKILYLMSSEIDTQSIVQGIETMDNKKDKMNMKRLIRKQKLNNNHECQKHKSILKMSKQQRIRYQKQKNRQAAQKSRDLHRQYVNSLEKEIMQLKQRLQQNNNICYRCKKYLSMNEELNFQDIQYHHEQSMQLFKPINESDFLFSQDNQIEYKKNQQDSFMRIYDPQESNNFIKMVLLIVVVCIGVMAINSTGPNINNGRQLLEVYKPLHVQQYQENVGKDGEYITKEAKNTHGLVQLTKNIDSQVCMDSLMNIENLKLKKSLRTIHHQDYQPDEGIFVCTFQTPKLYSIKPQMTQLPLVKLFVLGSQIKDMLNTSNQSSNLIDKNIQLNGIYRINAQLKSVELVTHHNCLL